MTNTPFLRYDFCFSVAKFKQAHKGKGLVRIFLALIPSLIL